MRKSKPDTAESPDIEPDVTENMASSDNAGDEVSDPLEQLQREADELREKNLRLLAEVQNQQKRAAREKQEALRYAEGDFARDLLPVLDDFERTRAAEAESTGEASAVLDGVRIVHEHLLKVLSQHGITPIDALHQPFDPSFHEAMLQQPSDEHPAGTVIQELARGYRMHDRVLRPSRVIVSSGPAAAASEEPAGGSEMK